MKKIIFFFILGATIFSCMTVLAINYVASEISFSSSNTEKTNVQDALDELYQEKNADLTFQVCSKNTSSVNTGGTVRFNNSFRKYKYFEITSIECGTNGVYYLYLGDLLWNYSQGVNLKQKYSTSDYNELVVQSTGNYCCATIVLSK